LFSGPRHGVGGPAATDTCRGISSTVGHTTGISRYVRSAGGEVSPSQPLPRLDALRVNLLRFEGMRVCPQSAHMEPAVRQICCVSRAWGMPSKCNRFSESVAFRGHTVPFYSTSSLSLLRILVFLEGVRDVQVLPCSPRPWHSTSRNTNSPDRSFCRKRKGWPSLHPSRGKAAIAGFNQRMSYVWRSTDGFGCKDGFEGILGARTGLRESHVHDHV
jgi:hypothetical protein